MHNEILSQAIEGTLLTWEEVNNSGQGSIVFLGARNELVQAILNYSNTRVFHHFLPACSDLKVDFNGWMIIRDGHSTTQIIEELVIPKNNRGMPLFWVANLTNLIYDQEPQNNLPIIHLDELNASRAILTNYPEGNKTCILKSMPKERINFIEYALDSRAAPPSDEYLQQVSALLLSNTHYLHLLSALNVHSTHFESILRNLSQGKRMDFLHIGIAITAHLTKSFTVEEIKSSPHFQILEAILRGDKNY